MDERAKPKDKTNEGDQQEPRSDKTGNLSEDELLDLADLVEHKNQNSQITMLELDIKEIIGDEMLREFEEWSASFWKMVA